MADNKKYFSDDNFAYFWQKLKTILEDKVSKETGKSLSTNDFSNDEKAKLTNAYNYIENTLKNSYRFIYRVWVLKILQQPHSKEFCLYIESDM